VCLDSVWNGKYCNAIMVVTWAKVFAVRVPKWDLDNLDYYIFVIILYISEIYKLLNVT